MAANTTLATRTITLRDGRTLAYTESGDPQGAPVLFSPGLASSRSMHHPDESIPQRLGLRLIGLDRPGYGRSTYRRGLTLLTWATDVAQLADTLGFAQFAMVGWSGGGPYALACAFKLPSCVRRVALLASMGPLADPTVQAAMRAAGNDAKLREIALLRRLPHGVVTLLATAQARAIQKKPEKAAIVPPGTPGVDRAVLVEPAFHQICLQDAQEAYRQGAKGSAADLQLISRPWGFDLGAIQVPVHIWQGEVDRNVPPAIGRHLAQVLPNCTATFLPDEGHISLFINHWREILEDLRG